MNVKKIGIISIIVLAACAATFFLGYSKGRARFDDKRTDSDTELIRKQDIVIESLTTGIHRASEEVDRLRS